MHSLFQRRSTLKVGFIHTDADVHCAVSRLLWYVCQRHAEQVESEELLLAFPQLGARKLLPFFKRQFAQQHLVGNRGIAFNLNVGEIASSGRLQ